MQVDRARYTRVAIGLHWLIAAGLVGQLALGLVMVGADVPLMRKFELYQLHKSVGVSILLAVVLRVVWRMAHRPPALPSGMAAVEKRAAAGAHLLLYALMLGLPLSGWAMVSASVRPFPTVLFGVLPWPHLPVLSTLSDKAPVEDALKWVHAWAAWSLIALVVLHVAAVARHAFRRDGIAWRMAPFPAWRI